jgi:nucleoside-diphosphate-sugar epimerase
VSTPHLLVLGATGKTGQHIVRQALERGCRVTAFVRDPARLGLTHPQLATVTGDLADGAAIDRAVAIRPDAVVSALGITIKQDGITPLADGTRLVLAAMARHGVRRLVVVSSLGAGDSRGQGNLLARLIQKYLLRRTLDDKTAQEALIAAAPVDATVFRPPQLTDTDQVRDDIVLWSGPQPRRRLTWKVPRATVARYALDAVLTDRHPPGTYNMSEPA